MDSGQIWRAPDDSHWWTDGRRWVDGAVSRNHILAVRADFRGPGVAGKDHGHGPNFDGGRKPVVHQAQGPRHVYADDELRGRRRYCRASAGAGNRDHRLAGNPVLLRHLHILIDLARRLRHQEQAGGHRHTARRGCTAVGFGRRACIVRDRGEGRIYRLYGASSHPHLRLLVAANRPDHPYLFHQRNHHTYLPHIGGRGPDGAAGRAFRVGHVFLGHPPSIRTGRRARLPASEEDSLRGDERRRVVAVAPTLFPGSGRRGHLHHRLCRRRRHNIH